MNNRDQLIKEEDRLNGVNNAIQVYKTRVDRARAKAVAEREVLDHECSLPIKAYMGEHSFTVHKTNKVWLLSSNKGFILDGGRDLLPFIVDIENKIFDVWCEGHFVDFGEDFFNAYVTYCLEEEFGLD